MTGPADGGRRRTVVKERAKTPRPMMNRRTVEPASGQHSFGVHVQLGSLEGLPHGTVMLIGRSYTA
jgi:hypothetical protein